jgi:hypothetical protein
MRTVSPKLRLLIFPVLFFAFGAQALYLIHYNSLTNDEPFEITGGYYYWTKGDVVTSRMQPPVAAAVQTLPLLFLHLDKAHDFVNEDDRAYRFFFESNLSKLKSITVISRLVNLLFGLGIGFLLLARVRKESFVLMVAVLGLWAFEPNLIAHSAIAKSDIVLAFFFFAAVLSYDRALKESGWKKALLTGLLTGVAITTKVTALALGPVYLGLEVMEFMDSKEKNLVFNPMKILARWAWVALGALIWIGFIYLPGTLLLPDHRCPYSYFLDKVLMGWRISQKGWAYYYYLGQTSDASHLLYLPMAFLFKSTLPFLILLFVTLLLWSSGKVKLKAYEWIAPLVFFLSVLPASNMGLRLMLPALPFLLLVAGRGAVWMWEGTGKAVQNTYRWALMALALCLVLSLALHFPNYLSYANETLSDENKSHFLADADLDWGQDQLRLCLLAKEKGWSHIKLALFAGVDPHFYGLDWSPWTEKDLQGPQTGWTYLVDTSFFQLGPAFFPETAPIAQGWALRRKPNGKLGDTWSYFELPGNPPKDESPLLHSAPDFRYYWNGNIRVFY